MSWRNHTWRLLPALVAVFVCSSLVASEASSRFVIGDIIAKPSGKADPSKPYVRMVVTQFAYPNKHYPIIDQTIEQFKKAFGENNFEARVYSGEDVNRSQVDLVLSSVGTYRRMLDKGARDLATVVSSQSPDPNQAEGSLFVTLATRGDINDFEDMRAKRVTATGLNAFSGYHVALGEIAQRGYNPDTFFSETIVSGHDMIRELELLRTGQADVAIVRTCLLEELKEAGYAIDDLKALAVREQIPSSGCLTSTNLYPNWTLFATPKASPEVARIAAFALLSMPVNQQGLSWGIASDFTAVDNLFRSIERGPYAYLRTWTWMRFWQEYWQWFMLLVLFLLGLAAHAFRSSHLVQVRTAQLRKALLEQHRSEKRAKEAQRRIDTLQKAGAIGQMSSIVAHELRQPLGAIINFAHGLQRLLEKTGPANKEVVSEGIDRMQTEARKAESIVQKVRSYAKGEQATRIRLDVGRLVSEAVETVRVSKKFTSALKITLPQEPLWIKADALEIELCVINLVKNALEVSELQKFGQVEVHVFSQTEGIDKERAVIQVSDNGESLTDQEFSKLSEPLSSNKIHGLGLGLSIVRLIVDNHGGRLRFERLSPKGVTAKIVLPLDKEKV